MTSCPASTSALITCAPGPVTSNERKRPPLSMRHGFALMQRARTQPVAGTQAQMQAKDLGLAVKLARELGDRAEVAEFFLERSRSR